MFSFFFAVESGTAQILCNLHGQIFKRVAKANIFKTPLQRLIAITIYICKAWRQLA